MKYKRHFIITLALAVFLGTLSNIAIAKALPIQKTEEVGKEGKITGFPLFRQKNCKHHNYMFKDAAAILGINLEQLKSELKKGKSMEQIVTDHGMTTEQFVEKMLALKKEKISQKVKDGEITQEQANKIYDRFEKHLKNNFFKNNKD